MKVGLATAVELTGINPDVIKVAMQQGYIEGKRKPSRGFWGYKYEIDVCSLYRFEELYRSIKPKRKRAKSVQGRGA